MIVANRTERLLEEIERGALDGKTSLSDVLRKVIALAARTKSTELRDWANKELSGYGPGDVLPDYRMVTAPIHIDLVTPRVQIRGREVSVHELPDFSRERMAQPLPLSHGVRVLEEFAADPNATTLHDSDMQLLVQYMNGTGHFDGQVMRMYWWLHPTVFAGVLDKIRNTLVTLVAEIEPTIPAGAAEPAPESVSSAVTTVVGGTKNKIYVNAAQTGGTVGEASAPSRWGWVRTAGAVLIGLVTIAGTVFALMQAQGWSF